MHVRALMPDDAGSARALVAARLGDTRYEARVLEQLAAALEFHDPEHLALLALEERSGELRALALFGQVAGARAVTKLHALLATDAAASRALLASVCNVAQHACERMIVCELADDAPFADLAAQLGDAGFALEGRVPDFIRHGVALRLFARRF